MLASYYQINIQYKHKYNSKDGKNSIGYILSDSLPSIYVVFSFLDLFHKMGSHYTFLF